jgi:hypothetical protein
MIRTNLHTTSHFDIIHSSSMASSDLLLSRVSALSALTRRQHRLPAKHSHALEQPAPANRVALSFHETHAQDPVVVRLLHYHAPVERLLAAVKRLDLYAKRAFGVRERVRENGSGHSRHGDAETVEGGQDEVGQWCGGEVGVEAREGVGGHNVAELAGGLC